MRLFLECKPDEVLALVAGVPRRAIVHSHGKGKVSNQLAKNSRGSGLVDEDPGSPEPPTLSKFVVKSDAHGVRLKTDETRNNRLVMLCPRFEDWAIETAKIAKVKMEKYSLSGNPRDFHAEVNQRLTGLERLLQELMERKSPGLIHLKSLLQE